MPQRKRHDYDRDKERLKDKHYKMDSIITLSFMADEYPNDVSIKPVRKPSKRSKDCFYENYLITLPKESDLNEMSKDRI